MAADSMQSQTATKTVKKSRIAASSDLAKSSTEDGQLVKTKTKHVDAGLVSLFQTSAGPIARPARKSRQSLRSEGQAKQEVRTLTPEDETAEDGGSITQQDDSAVVGESEQIVPKLRAGKKRKRAEREDDLEARYMRKLAREEEKEQEDAAAEARSTEQTNDGPTAEEVPEEDKSSSSSSESDTDDPPPQHESLSNINENIEVEKASRTVFLGNISTEAITTKSARKILLQHLASFFPLVKKQDLPFKVESVRFRSTAFSVKVNKKTAFIRQELMEETTKSTNAYAVYNSKIAAREAAKHLNGTIVLNRHLRVDQIAHPMKVDHKRCVFVGNLGFVDDDTQIREEANSRQESAKHRQQAAGDVEEGLWRQFSKAGTVESVRVVRDPQTRVGKGFAYVQFTDENGVEAALLYNDQKFPPLLPRKLRVMRAKSIKRNAPTNAARPGPTNGTGDRTLVGRAAKLLGRAGASQLRKEESRDAKRQRRMASKHKEGVAKNDVDDDDDDVIIGGHRIKALEGHRASAKEGKAGLKFSNKKQGKSSSGGRKPTHRGARRGEAWKKAKRDG